MNKSAWDEIVANLKVRDIEVCVNAAKRLQEESEPADVPRLLGLLDYDDFFIREAAAWPLTELAGPEVLSNLLKAYQRGFAEGHDNDGFTAALLEIPALHGEAAISAIKALVENSSGATKEHASWLLTFCKGE